MEDDFEDDAHFCLKCHNTILGLENYVNHRRNNCDLKQVVDRKSPPLPLPGHLLTNDDSTFTLKADDFFSSLELQSSSKKLVQQPSTSGKTCGVLTRSKVTSYKEAEPSKSGKSAWIGGEADLGKDDETRGGKDLLYEESDDESEEFDFDDEISDDDAPPRNHTGGKWKPSSPIYWKNVDYTPPPTFTGGKWKPPLLKKGRDNNEDVQKKLNHNKKSELEPPPDYTKGKWKPKSESFPPPEHTKGKWKPPDEEFDYTNNKTKSPDKSIVKLSEDSPLRKSGGTVQYYCRPCDRRLSSKTVYERHLKSEFHFKRTLRDNELEENLNFAESERRVKRKASAAIETKPIEPDKKKIRRKLFEKCSVCASKVNVNLFGKHLISHYHCRKADLSTELSQNMILNHIGSIILQSPFQCQVCRFYFNTQKDFLKHWTSETHLEKSRKQPGTFLCSFCKFECESNEIMYHHLLSEDHEEVVSVINRSVPIVIKKIKYAQCETCHEEFLLNIQLIKHCQKFEHQIPNRLKIEHKCGLCEEKFSSELLLQRHKKNKHNESTFFCGTCNLTYASKEEIKAHRKTEQHHYANLEKKNVELRKKCEHCARSFDNFSLLKDHIRTEHQQFHPKCPHCGMSFTIPQDLSVHLRTKSCKFQNAQETPKKNVCKSCFFSTDSLAQFMYHEALHGEPILMYPEKSELNLNKKPTPNYKCQKCNKFFPKSSLEFHLRSHTEERPYACGVCKATFARKNNWLFHEKKHTRMGTAPGKIKTEKTNIEEDTRPFLCSTCGASFKKRFVLQQHMKIHTGKLYRCIEPDCIFSGRSFGELKIHYQTHNTSKSFKCDLCNYTGTTKQNLRRHMRIHNEQKKYNCPHCPFSTRTSQHLKRHCRLHTGSKPYSCPHCNYKCNNLENLRKHVLLTNKHVGKSIYQCKFCDGEHFQTNFFKEFKLHLIKTHPKKINFTSDLYDAQNDSVFLLGNMNKSIRETTEEEVEKSGTTPTLSEEATTSEIHQNDDVLPLISLIVAKEETETNNWNLVECYGVEESGAVVPFMKNVNEEAFFEEQY